MIELEPSRKMPLSRKRVSQEAKLFVTLMMRKYHFLIFPLIIIVFYIIASVIVRHNNDMGRYSDPEITLAECIEGCTFRIAAYAAIFSSVLVMANTFFDIINRLHSIYMGTDMITPNCVSNNFFQFLMLLGCSFPYLILIHSNESDSIQYYIIFCESTSLLVIAAALVKLNCVDRNRMFKVQYSVPLLVILCVGQLVYCVSLVKTDNIPQKALIASYVLYYSAIAMFILCAAYEVYFTVVKWWRKEELAVFEILICWYSFILLSAFVALRLLRVKVQNTILYQDELLVSRTAFISIYILLAMFLTTIRMNALDFNSAQSSAISYVNKASELEILAKKLEKEKTKNYNLLREMLPPRIIRELQVGKVVTPESFQESTIFFSDIEGFTRISSMVDPVLVVNMLNQLYTMMDFVSSKFTTLYKVETIGDAYVICSGVPELNVHHMKDVIDFAIIVNELVQLVKSPLDNSTNIKIRIGCHTGPIIAGVVGLKMPRYCLFGDTINTTSRMESNGEAGKIHISESLAMLLMEKYRDQYVLVERGVMNIKGKGSMKTYFVQGATSQNQAANVQAISQIAHEINLIFMQDVIESFKGEGGIVSRSTSTKSSFSYSISVPNHPRRISAYQNVIDDGATNQYNVLVLGSIQMQQKIHTKLLATLLPDAVIHTADGMNYTSVLSAHDIDLILYDEEDPYITIEHFMKSVETIAMNAHIIALIADYRNLNHFKEVTKGKCAAILVKPLDPGTLKSIIDSLNETKMNMTVRRRNSFV